MEIMIYDNENNMNILNLNKSCILFGQNSAYKNYFINNLKKGLTGKLKNILINGKNIDLKDYNIICMNEDTDFANEFKFTKNNIFKQMIYNDVIDKINEDKIIDYTNEIFDIIDERVNKILNKNVNKKSDNNVSFQIEVPDVNSIIDKFTNIYIDNILINGEEISKSIKRKLLYQLYFWEIQKNNDKCNIILFENFDTFLSVNEIINIINTINKLTCDNCHFILTTCNNIFEYISIDDFSVYKLTDKLIPFNVIDNAIRKYIIRREFDKINDINKNFDKYYKENEYLIIDDEICEIKNKILNNYPHLISKILNCTNIKVIQNKPHNITSEYIICENKNMQKLFLEISNEFIL